MDKDKPLTLDGLTEFTHEVLLPAMDERFATKTDLNEFKTEMSEFKMEMFGFKTEMSEFKNDMSEFKNDMSKFKNDAMSTFDHILKKLDIILDEMEVRKYQERKQKELFAIMIKALKNHKILGPQELSQISKLEFF